MDKIRLVPLEKRKSIADKILKEYPDRLPIVLLKGDSTINIESPKYLVPKGITMAKLLIDVKKRANIDPRDALFILTENNTMIPSGELLSVVYEKYKNEDNFLYLIYNTESVFGR